MRHFLLAIALLPAAGWSKDNVQTYSVPKETTPALMSFGSSQPRKPVTWTTPQGWQEKPGSGMRLGQFVVPGPDGAKADLAVMAFPGDVGGELANVNRWRGEVGLEPVKEVTSESVAIGSDTGKLYLFTGVKQSTLVGWDLKDGMSYFFKLRGDKAAVEGAKPAMVEFLKSVKYEGMPSMAAAQNIGDPGLPNPHGSMPGMEAKDPLPAGHPPMDGAMPGMPAGHPPMDSAAPAMPGMSGMQGMAAMAGMDSPSAPAPVLETPAYWKEQPASRMVVKSYLVTDDKDGKAAVTVTTFPGQVGGTLANVNRWRAQIGLAPITEADLPTATKSVDVAGGKGTMVDITGKDGAGRPARLVAIMAPRNGAVWFFKLSGDGPVVEREAPNLVKLAQTARFP